ncbi:sigma-54 dependent transcriptional regulator [Myxococcota bacterium]|nr:sigma-54 dependent transcriptional regulator [Myxococcota bacterium]
MNAASILVVEDDRSAATYLKLLLEENGHQVTTAGNGVEALVALESASFDLMLTDLRMPEMDGLDLTSHVQQRWNDLPVILITANSDVSDVVAAMQLGAINYLVKPAAAPVVLAAVNKALRTHKRSRQSHVGVGDIVGESRGVVEVRHLVSLAARSDVHVLITGETGTGKELVATSIHGNSALSSGPLVAHNCAVSPRDLFESEFFGHLKGSFTGADREHKGLLTRAHEGVLFLDELEALELAHQAKLLRVLDDGVVRPVGSESAHEVSVRFLAATNLDPQQMMADKTLRDDLYYRLRGFEVRLPPLRERTGDIPLLVAHFLSEDSPGVHPDAMETFCRKPWPGNVRQLRNAVLSAQAAAGSSMIGVRHLSIDPTPLSGPDPASNELKVSGSTLRDLERSAIEQTLRECGGNRSRAAASLGIDRSTLRRKLKEFSLDS